MVRVLVIATLMAAEALLSSCAAAQDDRLGGPKLDDIGYPRAFLAEQAVARGGGGRSPGVIAGASRIEAMSRYWTVLSFRDLRYNAPPDPSAKLADVLDRIRTPTDRPPQWAVRKAEGRFERESVEWASSPDCDAIETVLGGMEDIDPPKIDVPGVGPKLQEDRIFVIADGALYRLWTNEVISADGVRSWDGVEMSSNVGTPLADWMDAALDSLAPCWSDAPPP